MTGRLVIMGSGETAPTMVSTHRVGIQAAGAQDVLVLDSPFGFQENVEQLTATLVDFFETSLGVSTAVARLRFPDADPVDRERFKVALSGASVVFAGPGSPSYALDVWRSVDAGELFAGVIERGGTLTLASAAALTAGTHTVPVYEIYKVGAPPHWLEGLDVMSRFGLRAVVIPHWNNAEGGNHDTSRCYLGERRLRILEAELDHGILGVDEHTAVSIDFGARLVTVTGKGTMTLRGSEHRVLDAGATLPLDEVVEALGAAPPRSGGPSTRYSDLRAFERAMADVDVDGVARSMLSTESRSADDPGIRSELRSMIVRLADAAGPGLADPRVALGGFVELLLDLRAEARAAGRYDEADRIRDRLAELGVDVRDTPDGPQWDLSGESAHRGQKP